MIEFWKLFNCASPKLQLVFLLAIHTGLRKSEIINLRWEDVNLKDKYILVRESKSGDSRIVPLKDSMVEELKLVRRKTDYVCSYKRDFAKAFYKALKLSGIAKCTFHDLRHTFATRLVMNNVDIVTVQDLMGHRNITTTRRYSHPTPEHKRKAIETLSMDNSLDTSASNREQNNDANT